MTSPHSGTRTLEAEIVREYGPFDGVTKVGGVSFDGCNVWAATGPALLAIDPASGQPTRRIDQGADAGTAFDGKHLWQIAERRIDKIDMATGRVRALGRARAQRWLAPPLTGFTTILLLPAALPSD